MVTKMGHVHSICTINKYNQSNDRIRPKADIHLPGKNKVIKEGKTVYNFFVEPQFSVADRGPGQPNWQIYFALNMQFY